MKSATRNKSTRTGLRVGLAGLVLAIGGLTLIPGTVAGAAVSAPTHRQPALTEEQQTCLTDQGVTKPEKGTKPTAEQRAAFKAAASACGITLPAHRN